MPESDDLLSKVLAAAAASGDAKLVDVHLALAAIAYELRTANLIAASSLTTGTDAGKTRRRMELDAIKRTGYTPPEGFTPPEADTRVITGF